MKNNQTSLKTQQWQLTLIQKLESFSDWLQEPNHKKLGNQLFGVFIVIFLLWGMFFVPGTILHNEEWPRTLVSGTSTIFPWITSTEQKHGASAGKFVFWQALSLWVFIIPLIIQSLAYRQVRLRKTFVKKKYHQTALHQLKLGIVLFCLSIVLNIWVFQEKSKFSFLVFNDYFSVLGASMCAVITVGALIEIVLAGIYLFHYFRSIKH
jgi:hypothetical protein